MTSPAALLRRRRAILRRIERARSNDALFAAGRELRREAQVYVNAGRPDLAQPYVEEAELFESAAQPLPGL